MFLRSSLQRSLGRTIRYGLSRQAVRYTTKANTETLASVKESLHISRATAEGRARTGHASSVGSGAPLALDLTNPKTIGGPGTGQTPEQLLGMAYASDFLAALHFTASKANKPTLTRNAKVHAAVYYGAPAKDDLADLEEVKPTPEDPVTSLPGADAEGFRLAIELTVEGVMDDDIILAAHEVSPFSRALRPGTEVIVRKMDHPVEEIQEEDIDDAEPVAVR